MNVSEDLFNQQIQDYGLVSPERTKNAVRCFFKKYGSKKLKGQDYNLKLAQQALCTICLADQARRLHCTVKLGKVFVDGSHEDTSSGRIQCSGQDFHMQGILEAMIDDFDSRWGDVEDINKYSFGTNGTNKGQPCGYTKG